MVSYRRLAREWALKILYQIDVGKPEPQEALETALEQLRMEFVHRGSRSASGSHAEENSLDFITRTLRDTLPTLRLPLERAVTQFLGRLFAEAPYWQEVRLERAFRNRAPGVPLQPAYLLTPLSDSALIPQAVIPSDGLSVQIAALTPEERARFLQFAERAREELPRLLEPEMRKTALAFSKELAVGMPMAAGPVAVQDYLRARREEFNRASTARWNKVGDIVQKQTGDWLRTAAFTYKLVTGVLEHRNMLDRRLAALSSGWRLERQVAVDRNILRIAAFEMLYLPGIPTGASINEAIELAKKYSTAESGRFVNGVLGALAAQVGDKLAPAAPTDGDIEADERDEVVDLPEVPVLEAQEA
ncbi:MAG TPA: transcription antitermination factor NusB [Chthonomonadaceae bacterium]|nr:transcription antitermination factor NusB [Chthonomonadaceae bacterium]